MQNTEETEGTEQRSTKDEAGKISKEARNAGVVSGDLVTARINPAARMRAASQITEIGIKLRSEPASGWRKVRRSKHLY